MKEAVCVFNRNMIPTEDEWILSIPGEKQQEDFYRSKKTGEYYEVVSHGDEAFTVTVTPEEVEQAMLENHDGIVVSAPIGCIKLGDTEVLI